jgi:hypothetical protein
MISISYVLFITFWGQADLRATDVFFAPKEKLARIIGKDITRHGEPGIAFAHNGYEKVWVDLDGAKMTQVRFYLDSRQNWKVMLSALGLSVSKAKVAPTPGSSAPSPMIRNQQVIVGVGGLPKAPVGKSWTVAYVEYAVPNPGKIAKQKAQIKAATGAERLRLIQSCYDWNSEIDFVVR